MTRPAANLAGQRFGGLVVQAREGTAGNRCATWTCLCDCGKETIVASDDLKREHITTCGCGERSGRRVREQAVLTVRVLLALNAAVPDGLTEREVIEQCGGTRWSVPRALALLAEAGVRTERRRLRICLLAPLCGPSGRSPGDPIPPRRGAPPTTFLVDDRWTTTRRLAELGGVSTTAVRTLRARLGSWDLVARELRERRKIGRAAKGA